MLHKLFFETRMSWRRVILFAVTTAFLAAVMLLLPVVKDTSLSYIGVTIECWVLFALIIIMNCERPLEAGCKTFLFFLISQPLIYLLQVPFYEFGWSIFRYYPRWLFATALCFPGGMIAWYVKKDNVLSALILSVATAFMALECVDYARNCFTRFPRELAALVFTVMLDVVLIAVLLKKRTNRLIAAAITAAAAAAYAILPLL